MIQARVLADSVSPSGDRLTTIEYTAHRFILAEINTHRNQSKNARSSRAVPTVKLIEEVETNPAMPVRFAANKPGMAPGKTLEGDELVEAQLIWLDAAADAVRHAKRYLAMSTPVHKQSANRVIEPYIWTHGVISATEWENYFTLRCNDHNETAQAEFEGLARAVRSAIGGSQPVLLSPGQWHLPYITSLDKVGLTVDVLRLVSAARCARVSYAPFDGNPFIKKELERAKDLLINGHWSPFEHQATPDTLTGPDYPDQWRNFTGWRQHRAMLDQLDFATRCKIVDQLLNL